MKPKLPMVIEKYFATDRVGDPQMISACFTQEAIVIDEGNTYTGRDAIRLWMANASTRYTYSVEPFALAEEDGRIVVTSRLVGSFPGSPIDLRYRFVIDGEQIAELEIAP